MGHIENMSEMQILLLMQMIQQTFLVPLQMLLVQTHRGRNSIQLARVYVETLFQAPRNLMGILQPEIMRRK